MVGLVRYLGGEEPGQLHHGSSDDLFVALADPVDLGTCDGRARGEYQLQHTLVLIVVLLAGARHICIHGEERRTREAQVVHAQQLPVEPHVDVDHRDA